MSSENDNSPQNRNKLWELSRQYGMGRRRFLQLFSAGGAAAIMASLGHVPAFAQEEGSAWFKDPEGFINHGKNLEVQLQNLGGWLTPNEDFFVRNNSQSLEVDVESYRLVVEGDGISTPLELTYDDLMAMPSHTVFSYIECGGNQRGMFGTVQGQEASGTQWQTGGISMAVWDGVPLAHILEMAGIQDNAVDVLTIGLDIESPEEGFRRAMPVEKALDPDTILAYRMNGAILPPDHGFPIRGLVPGWVGSSNTKWLGRIEVSTEKLWTRNNSTSYVRIGEEYPPESENSLGQAVYEQNIKSALMLPWGAEMSAGMHTIRGYAHSGAAAIAKVEYSLDGGMSWEEARVIDPRIKYAWSRFEFMWDATPGDYTITTRATDEAGNEQPLEVPFNEKGYLFNAALPHPVTVS